MSSGTLMYKPPFKVRDLKIPSSINTEPIVIKDDCTFYLTEIFIRPILNKIMNYFYGISNNQLELNNNMPKSTSIEKKMAVIESK